MIFFRVRLRELLAGCLANEAERKARSRHVVALVFWATLPTLAVGFGIRLLYDSLKTSSLALGLAFLATTFVLFLTRFPPRRRRDLEEIGAREALLVGLSQGIAAIPGISRTGTTISCGLLLGMERTAAATFSFLISLPVIAAANLYEAISITRSDVAVPWGSVLAGAAVAGVTGYGCLWLLFRIVKSGSFSLFALYTFPLSLYLLASHLWGGGV